MRARRPRTRGQYSQQGRVKVCGVETLAHPVRSRRVMGGHIVPRPSSLVPGMRNACAPRGGVNWLMELHKNMRYDANKS